MARGVGWITLPAGYLGSVSYFLYSRHRRSLTPRSQSLIGAALIFAGFDIVASKVASIVVGVFFLMTLWWARKDWLTILTILFAIGVIVGFWFIAHGAALRFYILFVGVMSSLYSVFDICDDLIFRKGTSFAKLGFSVFSHIFFAHSQRVRRFSLCQALRW